MKKFLIIVLIILVLLTVGCLDNYVPREEYDSKLSELEEANNVISSKSIEIKEAESYISSRDTDIVELQKEIRQYRDLIGNLNELLKNVYYGYASNENWILDGFTAFSIKYNDRFYLITAGHCVENRDTGKMTNFKFKANFSNSWIYPKLLTYENDYMHYNDYAIFYSDKIKEGLNIDYDNDYSRFLLGTINNDLNVIRENKNWGKDGECGSPVIDLDGEVTAIFIGYITPIERVLEAIDNLE